MNTTMHAHKVTKYKVGILSLAIVGILGTAGYVVGNNLSSLQAPVSAHSQQMDQGAGDNALVIDAAEYYLSAKGLNPDGSQIYALEIQGDSARGKIYNGDSGSVFYATKTDGRWNVVTSGQVTLSQSDATAYHLPTSWVGQAW